MDQGEEIVRIKAEMKETVLKGGRKRSYTSTTEQDAPTPEAPQ